MRGIVRTLIRITPPGAKGVQGKAAHNRGKARVMADIHKVVVGVPAKAAETTNIAKVVGAARKSNGRTRARNPRIRVPTNALKKFVREKMNNVGYLAAGLNPAAAKLGVRKPPAWIWKHDAPGAIIIRESSKGLYIKVANKVPYGGGVKGLRGRFRYAQRIQSENLKASLANMMVRLAKKNKFKTR